MDYMYAVFKGGGTGAGAEGVEGGVWKVGGGGVHTSTILKTDKCVLFFK